jgi:hypothetical protein
MTPTRGTSRANLTIDLENAIFDALMCREVGSFIRPLRGYKGRKIRREAHRRTRRMAKEIRRLK